MLQYAHSRRIRKKQYRARHKSRRTLDRPKFSLYNWTTRDQVGIKRLYRGPQTGPPKRVSVIGQFIDNKRTNYGKHKSLRGYKEKKNIVKRNSFKSEL